MTPLITKILSDEDFPSHPRVQTGNINGKPTYRFFIAPEDMYEENGRVYGNFYNSKGIPMRYVFRFVKFNMDAVFKRMGKELKGDFENLIIATEFIKTA